MTRESNTHRLETALLLGLFALVQWNPTHAQCQQAKLTPADVFVQRFGGAVDISGDISVVGAFGILLPQSPAYGVTGAFVGDKSRSTGNLDAAAHVFRREGGMWIEQAKLNGSDQAPNELFGASVSISGDCLVVGASFHVHPGSTVAGAAYVYRWDGTSWVEEAELLPTGDAYDFGSSVAIDGDRIIVGAPHAYDAVSESWSGAAYVFHRDGTTWIEEATLAASDGADEDMFGWSVAINGGVAVVGALDKDDAGSSSGAAYIFELVGQTWIQKAKLLASDATPGGRFGQSVATDSGATVVGATGASRPGGAAYVFRTDGATWIEEARLRGSDAQAGDWFGRSVSLSGEVIAVGAPWNDDACPTLPGCNSGAVYLFQHLGMNWYQTAKLTASDAAQGDNFGDFGAVAIEGDAVVVGARGAGRGAASIFSASECAPSIPAVSGWALGILAALTLVAGSVVIVRRDREFCGSVFES